MENKQSSAQPPREMSSARLESFSDGVLAVVITIMVLELRPPGRADLAALQSLIPGLLIYVLSFTFIGIYWNNHHHLLRAARRISGGVMWANLHLLFWLSLVPVVTAWVGAHPLRQWPTVAYGVVGFLSGMAYYILTQTIRAVNKDTRIDEQLGRDVKSKVSMALYTLAIAFALTISEPGGPLMAFGALALVAIMWFIPDRRLAISGDGKD
jgi:uncharacterized membrane protein